MSKDTIEWTLKSILDIARLIILMIAIILSIFRIYNIAFFLMLATYIIYNYQINQITENLKKSAKEQELKYNEEK